MDNDMMSMINSYANSATEEDTTNSEVVETKETDTESTSTTGDDKEAEKVEETEVVAPEEEDAKAPESIPSESMDSKVKEKPWGRVKKAEYTAAKWKQKFRKMREERDAVAAEFEKYRSFNPNDFQDEQDRQDYMAWKASQRQRLEDMNADLQSLYNEKMEEQYDSKINDCYQSEAAQEQFRELDNEYTDAFEYACNQYDPEGVIQSYLENSPYEPAMKNVIYKNGDLQEELFEECSNPRLGSIKKVQILQRLEREVANFYNNAQNQEPAKKNPEPTSQQKTTNETQKVKRFTLPQRNKPATVAPAPTPVQKPKVTGSITRGNESDAKADPTAMLGDLYTQLFGSSIK